MLVVIIADYVLTQSVTHYA